MSLNKIYCCRTCLKSEYWKCITDNEFSWKKMCLKNMGEQNPQRFFFYITTLNLKSCCRAPCAYSGFTCAQGTPCSCTERQNTGANDFSGEPHILQMGREDVSSPGLQPAGLASLVRGLCCLIHCFLGAILVLLYNYYYLSSRLLPDFCLMSCDIRKVQKLFRLHLFPF